MPTIEAPANTPTVIGWSTGASTRTASEAAGESKEFTMTANLNRYAQTKSNQAAKTITFNHNSNGTSALSTPSGCTKTSGNVACSCTPTVVYNGATPNTTCSITSPSITAPSNTPSIIGFSVATGNRTNSWTPSTALNISASGTYYAQTTAPAVTYTQIFDGQGADSVGGVVGAKVEECTIAATYNGTAQGTSCNITTPTIEWTDAINLSWSTESDSLSTPSYAQNVSMTLTSAIDGRTLYAYGCVYQGEDTDTVAEDATCTSPTTFEDTSTHLLVYRSSGTVYECKTTMSQCTWHPPGSPSGFQTGFGPISWSGDKKVSESEANNSCVSVGGLPCTGTMSSEIITSTGCIDKHYRCPRPQTACELSISPSSGTIYKSSTGYFDVSSTCSNVTVSSSSTSIATASINSDKTTVTLTGNGAGSATITVTASDGTTSETATYDLTVIESGSSSSQGTSCYWTSSSFSSSVSINGSAPGNPSQGSTYVTCGSGVSTYGYTKVWVCGLGTNSTTNTSSGSGYSSQSAAQSACMSSGAPCPSGGISQPACTTSVQSTTYQCTRYTYICS